MNIMEIWLPTTVCIMFLISIDAAVRVDAGKRANMAMPERRNLHSENSRQDRSEINAEGKNRQDLHDILNANSRYDFKVVRTVKIANGKTKQRIEVTFDDILVFGLSIQATYDEENGYTGALTGEFVSGLENDISDSSACQRNEDFLFSLGKKKSGLPAACPYCSVSRFQRCIYFDDQNKAKLAYVIEIEDDAPDKLARYYLVVDACSLSTLTMYNTTPNRTESVYSIQEAKNRTEYRRSNMSKRQTCLHFAGGTGGNPKIGPIFYGIPPFCLDVTENGFNCVLENAFVKVGDMQQTNNLVSAYEYDCVMPDDSINGANSANLDAFFFGNVMTRVFLDKYNTTPLPYKMILYTHYRNQYSNAVWRSYYKSAFFGDSDTSFYTLVSLDIVAHEIAHGIIQENSNLIYADQSGGVNEAFSDITGEAVENLSGYRTHDWLVGYDIHKTPGSALRSFQLPYVSHINQYHSGMDVHYSSGIFNKAFFEMVDTQLIPMEDAYHLFLLANQLYWNPNSGFYHAACGVRQAAVDLANDPNTIYINEVDAAFATVGINTATCGIANGPYDVLYQGRLSITVSPSVNPCFLLQPRSASWYYVYVNARRTRPRSRVRMTIINAATQNIIGSRSYRLFYYLPRSLEDRLICFSSNRATTVSLRTYYCGRYRCYF